MSMNDLTNALNTLKAEILDIVESLGKKQHIIGQRDI